MKILVENYHFVPESDQVIIVPSGYVPSDLELENFLIVTNLTDQAIIYLGQDTDLGGTFDKATKTLTLEHDCSSYSRTDQLQIFVDVPDSRFDPDQFIKDMLFDTLAKIVHQLEMMNRHLEMMTDAEIKDSDSHKSL